MFTKWIAIIILTNFRIKLTTNRYVWTVIFSIEKFAQKVLQKICFNLGE